MPTKDDLTTRRSCHMSTRHSRDPTPRPNRNARQRTTDLDFLLDGYAVTALVDTGADYSVMSGPFAAKVKQVKTALEGPQIRTAGGHLITPTGICTASITINDQTYPATFVILHGAIIDLRSKSITLSEDDAIPPASSHSRRALSVLEDQVSIPPRASIAVFVGTEAPADVEGAIDGDQRLLLDREICVARGVAQLRGGIAKVVLTNFSQEFKHINKGTTIAYIEEVVETSNAFVLSDSASSTPTTTVPEPDFPSLPMSKR